MVTGPATLRSEVEPLPVGEAWGAGAPAVLPTGAHGCLLLPAEVATPAGVAFLVRHSGGLVHAAMTAARLDELDIPPMVTGGWEGPRGSAGVSVDASAGTTTGISAADRAATLQTLADPGARPADLVRPGHVFPLRAFDPRARRGAAERAVELALAHGYAPVVALAVLVDDAGELLTGDAIATFAGRHGVPLVAGEP